MTKRDRLIVENTGLVHACVRKFLGRGVEYDDLYSSGCIGLTMAADNYDESLGFRFSTYAVPVILGEIKRVFRDGGAVKVSRSLKELSLRAQRATEEYRQRFAEEPTVSKIAELLGVSEEEAGEALCAGKVPMSLSSDLEDGSQIDVAVESEEDSITEEMTLHEVIGELPSDDRELIKLRYFVGKTQSQTAECLGTTQVQISRREKKILAVLRAKML